MKKQKKSLHFQNLTTKQSKLYHYKNIPKVFTKYLCHIYVMYFILFLNVVHLINFIVGDLTTNAIA